MLCFVNEFCITRYTSVCYTIRKHLTSDQRVGGSNPSRCTIMALPFLNSIWRHELDLEMFDQEIKSRHD